MSTEEFDAKKLSKMFLLVDNISIRCEFSNDSTSSNKLIVRHPELKKGSSSKDGRTIFTPVPTDALSVLGLENERKEKLMDSNEKVEKCEEQQTKTDAKKSCYSNNETIVSTVDTSILRTAVTVNIYFMQRKIGSTEMPCDGTLRSLLRFALKIITHKINNMFTFYVFSSVYEVKWSQSKRAMMKTPPSDNVFRIMLTPSMVDKTLIDIRNKMNTEEMSRLNFYIFIKRLNDHSDDMQKKHWNFNNILENE